MILSVPVIYRFCLTVVFFVAYRLVYGCILTYFVLNVNNSNYYCFAGFIYFCSKQFFTTFCQKRQKYARHIWSFHCRKRMCLAHSRASRSRVRQSISSRDCTLENSCPCTGIAFANSFIFLYNILIYHNVGDSVCQISLLRKYAVNITAWIFRTENPPRCRGGCKESEEFT